MIPTPAPNSKTFKNNPPLCLGPCCQEPAWASLKSLSRLSWGWPSSLSLCMIPCTYKNLTKWHIFIYKSIHSWYSEPTMFKGDNGSWRTIRSCLRVVAESTSARPVHRRSAGLVKCLESTSSGAPCSHRSHLRGQWAQLGRMKPPTDFVRSQSYELLLENFPPGL